MSIQNIITLDNLGDEFDKGNIEAGKIRLNTTEATHVLRSRINLGTLVNINATANITTTPLASMGSLNELGLTLGVDNVPLTAGNYEITVHYNLTLTSTSRPNFLIHLQESGVTVEILYVNLYARGTSSHDQVGASATFEFSTNGGTYNLATIREASGADTSLDGGYALIRRYEQKTVLTNT